MAFTKVATVQEIPVGRGKAVQAKGKQLALFNVGGTFYAIDDSCPHRGAPLSQGQVAGSEVVCPWHSARFDLKTGAFLSPPARSGVACYPVQVVGDEVQVDV
ncbi:MAG: non-heme iron oxygenase ferredoxin subunit [Gemmataceae bacterium]|nr:non-heme iron oxygenase ferredoxin subunit [Gemmataceae bacterium]MDW8267443.1 non-heme iron oxygenase ferredoxin subunit [Gemmataceae bacterium]